MLPCSSLHVLRDQPRNEWESHWAVYKARGLWTHHVLMYLQVTATIMDYHAQWRISEDMNHLIISIDSYIFIPWLQQKREYSKEGSDWLAKKISSHLPLEIFKDIFLSSFYRKHWLPARSPGPRAHGGSCPPAAATGLGLWLGLVLLVSHRRCPFYETAQNMCCFLGEWFILIVKLCFLSLCTLFFSYCEKLTGFWKVQYE